MSEAGLFETSAHDVLEIIPTLERALAPRGPNVLLGFGECHTVTLGSS